MQAWRRGGAGGAAPGRRAERGQGRTLHPPPKGAWRPTGREEGDREERQKQIGRAGRRKAPREILVAKDWDTETQTAGPNQARHHQTEGEGRRSVRRAGERGAGEADGAGQRREKKRRGRGAW